MIWLLAAHLAIDTLLFAYLCVTVNASLARMERHWMDARNEPLTEAQVASLVEHLTGGNTQPYAPGSVHLVTGEQMEKIKRETIKTPRRPRSMSQAQDMAESEIAQRTS